MTDATPTPQQLEHLPAHCSVQDIMAASERDGAVIIDNWVAPPLLAQFNAELEPYLSRHAGTDSGSAASDAFLGHDTRRLQGLVTKTPSFVPMLVDPLLSAFAETQLAPVSPDIILNNGELIDIGPGESAQPFHRDDDAWNVVRIENPLMVNSITALCDITPDMGSTLVVPGSHRWEPDRQPTPGEVLATELKAGSSLFFRGDTLHAGGANTSDKRRRALSIGLCCGWLRPVENSYTNVPAAAAARLPKRARQLLGYALYDASTLGGGYLGYHDMGDPERLFQ